MDSTQKVATITGASRGIGAGLGSAYRKLGYAVVATSRSVDSTDPEVLAVPGDLSRPGTGADVAEPALNRFSRIDTLVNDAGVLLAERGIEVDHVTVYRWVQRFTSEFIDAAAQHGMRLVIAGSSTRPT
jgi:NAD(P)-dependent dehydrogenase (short-subunit alcohol dehydrogenase family)